MSHSEFDISGQKVLLVGAGRGIGKGIALVFAEAGADVAITGLTTTGVNKVAQEVQALGRKALPLTGDATKASDMEKIVQQTLAEFGQVDTLVNCVGDSIRKPVVKLPGGSLDGMTEEDWHHVIDVNLTEAFQGCRALGSYLLERGQGSVINISGWASFRGRPEYSAYDAAKAGFMRFTGCLAQEWAPYGIGVNAIAPGPFPGPGRRARSPGATGWPAPSCRRVPRNARPGRCSPETAISCPTSIASASSPAVSGRAPGAGARPIS